MLDSNGDPRQIVLSAKGHILVRGGAGTGKTTLALRKAITFIDEGGLAEGQSVLFLSFSRAAVARIAQASKAEVPSANRRFLSLQTFHSFCWELLRTHGYLLGAPRTLKILLPQDERALSNGVKPASSEWAAWDLERHTLFHDQGRIAFDLFAPLTKTLLKRCLLIRSLVSQRYPLVIVDEAQDTAPDAWECIESLASTVQVLCLADLDQQIFDHLPGIGPERVAAIEKALDPLCVDLGNENNRSPGTEIATFANDVLTCKVRGNTYKGVSKFGYQPRGVDFQTLMRRAIAMILSKIEKETGTKAESCAILASSGNAIARITAGLNGGEKPIPHKVLFDEAGALLAARLAAFLLEPKTNASHISDVVVSLELLAGMKRATGAKTSIEMAQKVLLWATILRQGKRPRSKLVDACEQLTRSAQALQFSGKPHADWLLIKRILKENSEPLISAVASDLDYLVAFNRGRRISASLSRTWSDNGCYVRAREAVNTALAEDQILSGTDDLTGIHVMTIHRSKGKQFDGVIILREGVPGPKGWSSSFVWRNDTRPYPRSRKILRVAITRAIKHVLILDPFFPQCPILAGHKL